MSKHWCFTINNPADDCHDMDLCVGYTYCVIGAEISDSGTPHYQGFIQMPNRVRQSAMKKLLPRAHLEVMRGTSTQAMEYCKKDGVFQEFGEFQEVGNPKQDGAAGGKKKASRYREAIQLSKSGEFDKMEEEHPDMYWNSYHTMKRIHMDNPKKTEELSKLDNEWIWGEPGVGKSRTARKENPGAYLKPHNKWWTGYQYEEVVLYDDLGKSDAVWVGDFLKTWADHYPFPAEIKFHGEVIRPRRIIVTSNYSIEQLWSHDEVLVEAIKRRFKVRNMVQAPMFDVINID